MNRITAFALALLLPLSAAVAMPIQSGERPIRQLSPDKANQLKSTIANKRLNPQVVMTLNLTSISHMGPDGKLRREAIKFGTRQIAALRSGSQSVQIICLQKNVAGCHEPPYFSGGLIPGSMLSVVPANFRINRLHAASGGAIVIRTDYAALYPVNGQGSLQRLPAEQEDWIMLDDILAATGASGHSYQHRIVVRFEGHIFHYNYSIDVAPVA